MIRNPQPQASIPSAAVAVQWRLGFFLLLAFCFGFGLDCFGFWFDLFALVLFGLGWFGLFGLVSKSYDFEKKVVCTIIDEAVCVCLSVGMCVCSVCLCACVCVCV